MGLICVLLLVAACVLSAGTNFAAAEAARELVQCASVPSVIIAPGRLQTLCATGGAATLTPACTLQRLCTATGTAAPAPSIFPSLCNTTRLSISLCTDPGVTAAAIPECTSLVSLYGTLATLASCLSASALSLPSASTLVAAQLSTCKEMSGSGLAMGGCSTCTSTTSCPDPLASYAAGCISMDMGQCAVWTSFCAGNAAPNGAAAAVLCLSVSARAAVRAPPHPPPSPPAPPIAPPRPPSPPPPPMVPMVMPTTDSGMTGSPPMMVDMGPDTPPPPPLGDGSPCLQDPSQALCVMYVYPDAASDLAALCVAMPGMPACAMNRACLASSSTDAYCSSFVLLATGCTDMGTMAQCDGYVALCQAGSVVPQCSADTPVPGAPKYVATRQAVLSMCSLMAMDGCSACTTTTCSDPLGSMSLVCSAMDMGSCSALQDWCLQGGVTAAFPTYCGSASGSSGGVSDLPAMEMYFHQRLRDAVVWRHWIPNTTGQYVATCIAILFIGLLSTAIRTSSTCICAYWKVTRRATPLLEGGLGDHWLWPASGRQVAENVVTAVLTALTTTLDLFAMLVAMTFNIGFFVAVVLGYVLGALLLSHVAGNYSCALDARRRALRRRSAPTGAASAAAVRLALQKPLLPIYTKADGSPCAPIGGTGGVCCGGAGGACLCNSDGGAGGCACNGACAGGGSKTTMSSYASGGGLAPVELPPAMVCGGAACCGNAGADGGGGCRCATQEGDARDFESSSEGGEAKGGCPASCDCQHQQRGSSQKQQEEAGQRDCCRRDPHSGV